MTDKSRVHGITALGPHVHEGCKGLCQCAHPSDWECPSHAEPLSSYAERLVYFEERYGEEVHLCMDCECPYRMPYSHVYCHDDD